MNNQDEKLKNFADVKKICVVGVSRRKKFGTMIYEHLKNSGFGMSSIHPELKEFLGDKCYQKLDEIQDKPELVIIAVKTSKCTEILNDCVKLKINKVFFISGTYSNDSLEFCKKNGIEVIYKSCPFLIYHTPGFHKIHKTINTIFSVQPKYS